MPTTKVLVVEDDLDTAELLVRLLSKEYDVIHAMDGQEGLERFLTHRPMIVVLDWMLPKVAGIEVAERIRAADSNVYLVMVTALSSKENIKKALMAGVNDFIEKPFDADAVLTSVRAGEIIVNSQATLLKRLEKLKFSVDEIKRLVN